MKFLIFGSLNIDYVYKVENIVHEGETVSSSHMDRNAGGKGLNQAVAVSRAGGQAIFAGCVGADGGFLTEVLSSTGTDISMIRKLDAPTGHAVIQIDKNGKNCIIVYGGANHLITEDYVDYVLSEMMPGDCVVLQNEINSIGLIINKASEKGLAVVLNPSPFNDRIFTYPLNKVSVFNVNEHEGALLAFGEKHGNCNPEDIIKKIAEKFPKSRILLTLGREGSMFYDGRDFYSHCIYDIPVCDTTAAGDTFTGYFLTEYFKGTDIQTSLKKASAASAICVSRNGASVSVPVFSEVDRFMDEIDNK